MSFEDLRAPGPTDRYQANDDDDWLLAQSSTLIALGSQSRKTLVYEVRSLAKPHFSGGVARIPNPFIRYVGA
jgi:hypothetical protein